LIQGAAGEETAGLTNYRLLSRSLESPVALFSSRARWKSHWIVDSPTATSTSLSVGFLSVSEEWPPRTRADGKCRPFREEIVAPSSRPATRFFPPGRRGRGNIPVLKYLSGPTWCPRVSALSFSTC